MHEMRIQFSELLADIGFIATTHAASLRREFRNGRHSRSGRPAEADTAAEAADLNDGNLELIRAIICASLYPNASPRYVAALPVPFHHSGREMLLIPDPASFHPSLLVPRPPNPSHSGG
jgi:hypothetical protein